MERLSKITKLTPATNGEAMLVGLEFVSGNRLDLELLAEDMHNVLAALIRTLPQLASTQRQDVPLPELPPHLTVALPSEDIEARAEPNGALWLVLRCGPVDFSIALPDPRSTRNLGQALIDHAQKAGH